MSGRVFPERINYEVKTHTKRRDSIPRVAPRPTPDTPYIQVSSFWCFTEFAHDWFGLLPQSCLLFGKHKMIMCLYTACWDTLVKKCISTAPSTAALARDLKDKGSSAHGLMDYSRHDRAAPVLRTKPKVSSRSSGPFWFPSPGV